MLTFPRRWRLMYSSSAFLSRVRSKPNMCKIGEHFYGNHVSTVIVMNTCTWKQCFEGPGSYKRWRTIHSEWLGRVMKTDYIKHDICHITMPKEEWICTCRTNECSVLTNVIRILSGMDPRISSSIETCSRTRSKRFKLCNSMCNGIMCFVFLSQKNVSKKNRRFHMNLSDKKISV